MIKGAFYLTPLLSLVLLSTSGLTSHLVAVMYRPVVYIHWEELKKSFGGGWVWVRKQFMNIEMWSLNAFCVKALNTDPHWLLSCRLCEEFWKSELSIKKCVLPVNSSAVTPGQYISYNGYLHGETLILCKIQEREREREWEVMQDECGCCLFWD